MTFCFADAAVPAEIERARAAVNVTDPPTILEKIRLMCELPMTPSDQIMRSKNPQSSGCDFSHSAAREICATEVRWGGIKLGDLMRQFQNASIGHFMTVFRAGGPIVLQVGLILVSCILLAIDLTAAEIYFTHGPVLAEQEILSLGP